MGCEDFVRTLISCMIFLWSAVTCASIFLTSKEEALARYFVHGSRLSAFIFQLILLCRNFFGNC